jgi:hypothetical protein
MFDGMTKAFDKGNITSLRKEEQGKCMGRKDWESAFVEKGLGKNCTIG